ncbi:hypothetical protein TNCV_1131341 [Trichonephila clavipes]|nr:hypothetical protein TNCV_1131341 [Trichonephila clavipes]
MVSDTPQPIPAPGGRCIAVIHQMKSLYAAACGRLQIRISSNGPVTVLMTCTVSVATERDPAPAGIHHLCCKLNNRCWIDKYQLRCSSDQVTP